MRIALHVFQAAVPPVRKSRRRAQRWKNIAVDRISSVWTRIGTADDAFIITFVSHLAEEAGYLVHSGINEFVTPRASRKMSRGRS
jgi:hypothetical protein